MDRLVFNQARLNHISLVAGVKQSGNAVNEFLPDYWQIIHRTKKGAKGAVGPLQFAGS
jgi:hypothetical protein